MQTPNNQPAGPGRWRLYTPVPPRRHGKTATHRITDKDDIAKVQNSKVKVYTAKHYNDQRYYPGLIENIPHEIEISVGNKTLSVNGNYKAGMIKQFIKANQG